MKVVMRTICEIAALIVMLGLFLIEEHRIEVLERDARHFYAQNESTQWWLRRLASEAGEAKKDLEDVPAQFQQLQNAVYGHQPKADPQCRRSIKAGKH